MKKKEILTHLEKWNSSMMEMEKQFEKLSELFGSADDTALLSRLSAVSKRATPMRFPIFLGAREIGSEPGGWNGGSREAF